MLTSRHPGAYRHMQLGAGAFLINFEIDQTQDAQTLRERLLEALQTEDHLLGVTRGGGVFRCTPKLRFAEADGQRIPCADTVWLDSWQVTLSGTLLELNPTRLAMLLPGALVSSTEDSTAVTISPTLWVEPIPRLTWAGETGGGLLLIELRNAVPTSGTTLTFADHTEGSVPFTFEATQQPGEEDVPVRILFLNHREE